MKAVKNGGDTRNETVPSQVLILAPFHVDVGFVNEKNGVPSLRTRKIVIEVLLRLRRHSADITYGQREERTLGVCRDAFCFYEYISAGNGVTLQEIPAVYVLPTPGLPCSKKILPSPFPATKSATQGLCAG